MGEGVRYINGLHLCDFTLADVVELWKPRGYGMFYWGWDWMDAPFKDSNKEEEQDGFSNNRK